MLTIIAKNKLLDQIKTGLNDAYLIEDPSLTITLGAGVSSVNALAVSYPVYFDLVWGSATFSKVITTNNTETSNPINFSVKPSKAPNRLVIVSSSNIVTAIFDLPTPVPSYTVAGPYYIRQLFLEITEA